MLPRRSRAQWGTLPAGVWQQPPDCKVLEVFLYGGLAPWESFYVQPHLGDGFRDAEYALAALNWGACTGGPSPSTETRLIGNDADGQPVHLGPLTKPLWRADILSRLRVVTMAHGLEPHEAAIPLALTGRELGNVRLAGLGTAIAHHWQLRAPGVGPRAYVLAPPGLGPSDNLQAAVAIGQHPATAKPLLLEVGNPALQTRLTRALRRPGADEVWSVMRETYVDQTRTNAMGPAHRSKALTAYETAADAVLDSPALESLLDAAPLDAVPVTSCVGSIGQVDDNTGASIHTAAYLLSEADGPRHVTVIDNGLVQPDGVTGYDTHSSGHISDTAINLWNCLSHLASVIRTPGGPAAGKIDLDETIILLNTEFGRTPSATGAPTAPDPGREHHPGGYVTVLIGGPVGRGNGASVVGAIGAGGFASMQNSFVPADVHAAVMLAAGVWPFEPENFNQSAVSPKAPTDLAVAQTLVAQVLGY